MVAPCVFTTWGQTFTNSSCSAEGTCVDATSGTCYGKSEVIVDGGKLYEESSCSTVMNPTPSDITTKRVEAQ
jgi:hypothetical protein